MVMEQKLSAPSMKIKSTVTVPTSLTMVDFTKEPSSTICSQVLA
jgi:hypothetical protein